MTNDVKEVVEIFNKQYPELTVIRVVQYDDHRYLVLSSNGSKTINFNGSWYGVDTSKNEVSAYSPVVELEKFFNLVQKNTLYKM